MENPTLVLASASPRRLALLEQIGVPVAAMVPSSVDETPLRAEKPAALALRLATLKAEAVRKIIDQDEALRTAFILSADTVVAQGRRPLPKAETVDEAETCLRLLSGRSHRVYTGIALIAPDKRLYTRTVESRVRFKRFSEAELAGYLGSGEWRGKAGGYAIQGIAGAFAIKIIGSYSSIVGLPLYETLNLLGGAGYQVHKHWQSPLD